MLNAKVYFNIHRNILHIEAKHAVSLCFSEDKTLYI